MIKLIVLDVDGTLTDGGITYNEKGVESKTFNVKDGLGIAGWIKLGKKVAIITGRKSKILELRAKELGITYLKQGISNKALALKEILEKENIKTDEFAVIGDDLNDLSMLNLTKFSFAPKDCAKILRKKVYKVLKSKGGKGAVREMIDFLIKKEKLEEEFYALF
ncbi:KdsC family phosphatase [Helicobacter burdigaliensis]|uniref:KdsC family phosphatase n=1 Tax=Helicobacter burdigaliensis TaxID=2315334 RepID=UPI000EF6BDBA|nr:HAD hydrolase family protein [Helicobacter burdigaliensis]